MTSVPLLGAPETRGVAARVASATNAAGAYATIEGRTYVCAVAGIGTNLAALAFAPGDIVDGAATWRPVLNHPRKGMVIVNASTNSVYLSDRSFTGSIGIYLAPNGGTWSMYGKEVPTDEIWVRAGVAASSVLSHEW